MSLTIGELTSYIDTAFQEEWTRRKTISLPAGGEEDRQLLFAAVARGVLTYLKAKEGELVRSINTEALKEGATTLAITGAVLNIDQP